MSEPTASHLRTISGVAPVLRAYADETDAERAVPADALRDLAARLEQIQAEMAARQELPAEDFPP